MFKRCKKCRTFQPADGQKLCVMCAEELPEPVTVGGTAATPAATPADDDVAAALAEVEAAVAADAPTHKLGDKVAVIAKALGFVQTPGCGCQQRQENLNYVNFNQPILGVAKEMVNALRVKKGGT